MVPAIEILVEPPRLSVTGAEALALVIPALTVTPFDELLAQV